ncbi:MAG: hypothetical protein CSB34_03755 [Desulfobulbus propionicus]|nr:MAG: hypothetical protein CSB34_03755 [Desulfobulbus propionicus]PIE63874.1 MAG: hypothetical protein CSA26_10825 [Desulfobacterales bacterium]
MFDKTGVTPQEITDARKEKIEGEAAWKLLSSADELIIGRGKKFTVYNPKSDDKEIILKQSLGRTGNLRAPTLKIGNKVIVGFSEDMYNEYVG